MFPAAAHADYLSDWLLVSNMCHVYGDADLIQAVAEHDRPFVVNKYSINSSMCSCHAAQSHFDVLFAGFD